MTNLKEKLKLITPVLFNASPVLFAYLYGSQAKGNQHPFSDTDIGIYVEGLKCKESLDLELSLSLQIDEMLNHSISSEVRVLNHLPLAIKGNIIETSQLIYSRDENKRTQFEKQVRLAYFDFLPVIRQYQKIYRETALSSIQNGLHR